MKQKLTKKVEKMLIIKQRLKEKCKKLLGFYRGPEHQSHETKSKE